MKKTFLGTDKARNAVKATIVGPNDFDEYEIHYFERDAGGVYRRRHSATYFTDDRDDAIGTARHMTGNMTDNEAAGDHAPRAKREPRTQHLRLNRPTAVDDFDADRFTFLRAKPGDLSWNTRLNRLYAYPAELRADTGGTIAIDFDPERKRPWLVYATAELDRSSDRRDREMRRHFKSAKAAVRCFRDTVKTARARAAAKREA